MKTFVLFGIDAHRRSHLICAFICTDIAAAPAALGGRLKDIGPSRDRAKYRSHFPGHQLCGIFVPGGETPERLARIEHPDASREELAALTESHRWATDCYREYLLGSVPTTTVDQDGRRA